MSIIEGINGGDKSVQIFQPVVHKALCLCTLKFKEPNTLAKFYSHKEMVSAAQ